MIHLSLNELKLIAKSRSIKDYENKSEDDLIKILSEPKPKINLSKNKIKEIKKDFNELRYGFSKSKIKEIRRNLYDIKNRKILLNQKQKNLLKNLLELEKSLFRLKKYYDCDDTESTLFVLRILNKLVKCMLRVIMYKLWWVMKQMKSLKNVLNLF